MRGSIFKAGMAGLAAAALFIAVSSSGCAMEKGQSAPPGAAAVKSAGEAMLAISSPAFTDNGTVPVIYSCRGQNISPPLKWGQPPAGTKSLVLIMDDPDTARGTLNHWLVFNIPPDAAGLAEAVLEQKAGSTSFVQGSSTFGKNGYSGPCPPAGNPHRYRFNLYALDTVLQFGPDATKSEVLAAMQGHILGRGLLTGLFP